MYRNIDVAQLQTKMSQMPLVDLRSPLEYLAATIPGAYNIPLLDNIERAMVGIAYKNQGVAVAKELAMTIITPKLPGIISAVKEIAPSKEIAIFCWRGGHRSHFTGCLLDTMGYKVHRLSGGYKAFRKNEYLYLKQDFSDVLTVVLHGLTGVGKTDVLLALKKQGWPVIDLEGLAQHRGSVFGKIGQPVSPSQKNFDSLIAKDLRLAQLKNLLLVECEGKKIGQLYVPTAVTQMVNNGIGILLYTGLENRIERIKRDYLVGHDKNHNLLQACVQKLVKYIGKNKVNMLNQWLKQGEVDAVIEFLLLRYYDPLYQCTQAPHKNIVVSVCNDNLEQSLCQINNFLNSLKQDYIPGGDQDVNWGTVAASQGKSRLNGGGCRTKH